MFQLLLLCVLQSCRFGCCCIKCQLAVNAFGMINISANIVAEAVLYNVHADAAENVTVNLVSVDADGCVVCMQDIAGAVCVVHGAGAATAIADAVYAEVAFFVDVCFCCCYLEYAEVAVNIAANAVAVFADATCVIHVCWCCR